MSAKTDNCKGCGNECFVTDLDPLCKLCYDCYFNDEGDYDTCSICQGTGISATGRVDDSCSNCHGSGAVAADYEEEPDDYDPYEHDDYMADKAAAEWENSRMNDNY